MDSIENWIFLYCLEYIGVLHHWCTLVKPIKKKEKYNFIIPYKIPIKPYQLSWILLPLNCNVIMH